ncbi:hypothetical protein JCM10207_004243 [Rhodosporidiobolus poonsookiae]
MDTDTAHPAQPLPPPLSPPLASNLPHLDNLDPTPQQAQPEQPPAQQQTTQQPPHPPSGAPPPVTVAFGSSPPLPPVPREQHISLSESLAQLQDQAAFVPKQPAQPPVGNLAASQHLPPPVPAVQLEENELRIDGLTARELFVRLPEHDPVAALLEKYLPPQQRPVRDLSGNWEGQKLEGLVASRNRRGCARYAYNAITQAAPERTSYILSHWLLRFHSLLRLRLIPQLAVELSSIFSLLPPSSCLAISAGAFPPDTPRFHPAVPFDLHILAAALPGLQGHKQRSVETLAALLKSAKEELWAAKAPEEEELWRGRAEQVGRMLTDLLLEIKANSTTASLLSSATPSPSLHLSLTRLAFSSGNVGALSQLVADPAPSARSAAVLELVAQGKWEDAEGELTKVLEEEPDNVEATNNLAVVLLYRGKVNEAITILTGLFSSHPSHAHNNETILFNLATLFELRTEQAGAQKVRMLRSAAEFGAQGVDAGAFKLVL